MRPVLPGDLSAAARALLTVPSCARPSLAHSLLEQAEAADRYRRREGRAHPLWGNGSLQSAALARRVSPEPCLDDPEYLDCQIAVLEALRLGAPHPAAHSTQSRAVGSSASRPSAISSPQSSQ